MHRAVYRTVLVSLLLIVPFFIWFAPTVAGTVVEFFLITAPVWLPFVLISILAPLWLLYVRSQYVSAIRHTVLELKPGDDTPRSARAMELFFFSLYYRTEISRVAALAAGQVRLPWSFDIYAHAGKVRFFMRIPTSHRAAIEARLRAEYRDVDIDECQDYARMIPFSSIYGDVECREFHFIRPDPYPLKTYQEYETMKKPEDPYMRLLEKLVGIGDGEHFMISFLVRPHHRERAHVWEEPEDTLHHDAQKEIQSLVGPEGNPNTLPETTQDMIRAIEHALKKPSFDCGIRAMYLAEQGKSRHESLQLLENLFVDFEAPNRNAFTATNIREHFHWPLSDVTLAIPRLSAWYQLHLFRRRAFFAPPYYGKAVVLNTAELATLFRLPYISRTSPLSRMHGKRLEAPENLPIVA